MLPQETSALIRHETTTNHSRVELSKNKAVLKEDDVIMRPYIKDDCPTYGLRIVSSLQVLDDSPRFQLLDSVLSVHWQ